MRTDRFLIVLACFAAGGCQAPKISTMPVKPVWDIPIRDFKWSESPRESILRLEAAARSATPKGDVRIVWPESVREWKGTPPKRESGNLMGMVYDAAIAANIGYTCAGTTVLCGVENWRGLVLSPIVAVRDGSSGTPIENAEFRARGASVVDVLVLKLRPGSYFVPMWAGRDFLWIDDTMVIPSADLDGGVTLTVHAPGYVDSDFVMFPAVGASPQYYWTVQLQLEESAEAPPAPGK